MSVINALVDDEEMPGEAVFSPSEREHVVGENRAVPTERLITRPEILGNRGNV